jgi:hypothetical protein
MLDQLPFAYATGSNMWFEKNGVSIGFQYDQTDGI